MMSSGELSEKSRVDREDSIERYRRAFLKRHRLIIYEDDKIVISLVHRRPGLGEGNPATAISNHQSNGTASDETPNQPQTQNPKPRIRLFSPLTNTITAFIMSIALICVPLLPTYAAALPCEDKDWTSKFSNDCGECPPCPIWRKQLIRNGWYECVKSKSGHEDCIEKR